ncbi:hypothetical protein [Kocuria sp. cx-455]|uniref:hypothetical protein n=1 Tax=Kocuria sp. cx-455 TaxID=2771377 RepID=UPI003D73F26E
MPFKKNGWRKPTAVQHSTLLTCYNDRGQQVPVPSSVLSVAFTGFQHMSRGIFGSGPEEFDLDLLDVTFMQVGPSSFDFRFDIRRPDLGKMALLGASGALREAYPMLARAMTVIGTIGEATMLIAAHPGCELRRVETHYGPDVEVLVDSKPRLIFPAQFLDLVRDPAIQAAWRAGLSPLSNPNFAYVTARGEIHKVQGLANQVIICNEHLRDFISGDPLQPMSFEPTIPALSQAEQEWGTPPE